MIEKTMTKKALRAYYNSQRSQVSQGMNTGTRYMASNKDWDRQKRAVNKMLRAGAWD